MNVYYIVILCLMCSHHDSMKLFEITFGLFIKKNTELYIYCLESPERILMNSWHYKILYIFCVPICNIFCKCIFFLESAVKYLCVWVTFYAPLQAVERIYNDKFLVLKTKIWKYWQKTRNIYILLEVL